MNANLKRTNKQRTFTILHINLAYNLDNADDKVSSWSGHIFIRKTAQLGLCLANFNIGNIRMDEGQIDKQYIYYKRECVTEEKIKVI